MNDLRSEDVEALLDVLVRMDDKETLFALLEDLTVARMLDAGKSYAAIEQATGASATTIARVSKCLSYGTGGYRAALDLLAPSK